MQKQKRKKISTKKFDRFNTDIPLNILKKVDQQAAHRNSLLKIWIARSTDELKVV